MVSTAPNLRQRTVPASSGSESDTPAKTGEASTPASAQKRDHHHHEEEEHDHDQPIDEEKLDNLLWEISKFCIPVGFFLYLSIYLCYRHELYKWFTHAHTAESSLSYSSADPLLASFSASPASVDAPAPTAGASAGEGSGGGGDRFEKWVKREEGVAWAAMAANVGPEAGAADGVVVAASSKGEWEDEPDYHFTWTRDAALTISAFLPRFLPSSYLRPWVAFDHRREVEEELEPDYLVEPLVRAYISSQAAIQGVQNPSGGLMDGGLNEPKFHVDGSAFTGDWGRPQRDGPALRALALIPYALYLLDRGYPADTAYVNERLYDASKIRQVGKVIKNDLEEVGGSWALPGFDLWEEVDGYHIFTLLVSLRALQAGENLALRLNDTGAAEYYALQATEIETRLADFWDDAAQYYRATVFDSPHHLLEDHQGQAAPSPTSDDLRIGGFARKERSGLDCAIPLAILHAGDDSGEWSAVDDKVLSTLRAYVRSFEGMYAINHGRNWTEGWAVGRYKEDVYNGIGKSQGNPWFICTFAVTELLYRAKSQFERQAVVDITELTVPFWSDILGEAVTAATMTESVELAKALQKLGEVGDAFLKAGSRWVSEDGRMSEQIHRWDGSQVGARDLTWSYASLLGAVRARRGQ